MAVASTVLGAVALTVLSAVPAAAVPSAAVSPPEGVELCRMSDPRLTMVSGIASDGTNWYVVNDHDPQVQVFVLNRDCSVARVITTGIDHYDVGDVAVAPDGTIWVAETGDNRRRREHAAFVRITPDGVASLHRVTYPRGPHDAEALLLDRDGVPHIVTKEIFGTAYVYRPAEPLRTPGPVPLEEVGTVRFRSTTTPGGPIPELVGSVMVTGGSVSADGTVVALRTYTEAYLFSAPDGDVVAALAGEPVNIPIPDEPQGEAIALEPDGTLLSTSEGENQPIRAYSGAVELLAEAERSRAATASGPVPSEEEDRAEPARNEGEDAALRADDEGMPGWQALGIAGLLAALLMWVVSRSRRA
ncbi:hypothetical protein [Actinoalloteichus spitiensis]|uniref:hypothetical protein n=1 Tax=Actinoalloteichus spitiensis TaxID=252394 RepID=UPI00037C415A|nr:hypothetical protein [Actinoalloteichus spitiensis]